MKIILSKLESLESRILDTRKESISNSEIREETEDSRDTESVEEKPV